jgi:uncharacterized protein YndB with AHSA1/START domain/DNA-binding transcriptional ArsR family regulator
MNDRIEKRIELKAPVSRVWRALTDYREFGEWFRVKVDGPFVPGQVSSGQVTYPGYEHLKWEAVVQKMEPERLFSFTWHPYAVDPKVDYSKEPSTLVEFRLEKTINGTLLLVTESGFDKIPSDRRFEAFRMNDRGWTQQMKNIESYVAPQRQAQAPVFAALGDETRLSLVARLCTGQAHSISQLTEGSRLTRQAISKHLRVLEGVGIVRGVRAGRENRYEFVPQPIEEIKEYLNLVSEQWDRALARLKSFVED